MCSFCGVKNICSSFKLLHNFCIMPSFLAAQNFNLCLIFLSEAGPSLGENKWVVIVDRMSLLLIQSLSGLYKVQEQSWRLLELHGFKIVSSGIIWVSLQEVRA